MIVNIQAHQQTNSDWLHEQNPKNIYRHAAATADFSYRCNDRIAIWRKIDFVLEETTFPIIFCVFLMDIFIGRIWVYNSMNWFVSWEKLKIVLKLRKKFK